MLLSGVSIDDSFFRYPVLGYSLCFFYFFFFIKIYFHCLAKTQNRSFLINCKLKFIEKIFSIVLLCSKVRILWYRIVLVSWVRCGILLYRFLFLHPYFVSNHATGCYGLLFNLTTVHRASDSMMTWRKTLISWLVPDACLWLWSIVAQLERSFSPTYLSAVSPFVCFIIVC